MNVVLITIAVLLGAFTWSFAEYALHNWVFHKTRKNLFSKEHIKHHAIGNYFAPTWAKVINATVVLGATTALLTLVVGIDLALGYGLGVAGGYVAYEVQHRRLHTHGPTGWYGRWARKHHFHHHFINPRMNHGVTSPLWDYVFKTYEDPGVVRVPVKLAPEWVWDRVSSADVPADSAPASGWQVRPEFAADYQIMRGRARAA